MTVRLTQWFDNRLGATSFVRSALNKVFPDHWSFMLGEVALYCFVILVLTGTYLTFFFNPSSQHVVYHGRYAPLNGVQMTEAYRSTIRLSFDVRAGLVFRQIHHWAALLFVAAIVTHLCRIFFTGAFRRPRELNWIIGVTLLVLAIFNGFSGYSMPDDLLSGTGLRIAFSIAVAVPFIGTWAAFLLFGGEFPGTIITRLFVLHIMVVPALIGALLAAHLAILWRQKHTQFAGQGRMESNVMGSYLWPTYAARSVGLFAAVFAALCALGGLAQINPVWLYGPFHAPAVSTAAQPDWYMGWLEGALRLFPGWRLHIFGYSLSELFWPGVFLPGITFGLLYMWPFMEARITGDRAEHHLLDRPRDRPIRTAIGVGVLTFYVVLTIAGAQDIIAQKLSVSIPPVTWTLRVLVIALPLVLALVARRICLDLQGAAAQGHSAGVPPVHGGPIPALAGAIVATGGAPDQREPQEAAPPSRSRSWVMRAAGAVVAGVAAGGGYVLGRRRPTRIVVTKSDRD
ncbi:MAG: cytochrome bc complex cytochrome b subunit [Actinobacteria bacterium]|nr:cytochrome bc complex cytochrome b subunit [Actinomycetota bacterium]MBV9254100.1 cytochrome bc complex cytochrome b subunit [Actinomycetota bacterium]